MHQDGVSFDLYCGARKHKIKTYKERTYVHIFVIYSFPPINNQRVFGFQFVSPFTSDEQRISLENYVVMLLSMCVSFTVCGANHNDQLMDFIAK